MQLQQSTKLTRIQLVLIKRQLLSAHLHAEESEAAARACGDDDLSERCRDIGELLKNEISYIDMLLARLARQQSGN